MVLNDETTDVGHDRTEHVKNDETITIDNDRLEHVKHNETITIDNDRTETVKHNESITIENDRMELVKNDETVTVENDQHKHIKNNQYEDVDGDKHNKVKGDRLEKITGSSHLKITGSQNEEITGSVSRDTKMSVQEKMGLKYAVDAGAEVHIKAGASAVIESTLSITLQSAESVININPAGVFIDGPIVLIKSNTAIPVPGTGSNPDSADSAEGANRAVANNNPNTEEIKYDGTVGGDNARHPLETETAPPEIEADDAIEFKVKEKEPEPVIAEAEDGFGVDDGVSMGLDFIPFVGAGKSIAQLISGTDLITGEPTPRWIEAVGILAGVFGAAGIAKGILKGGSSVLKHGDEVADVAKMVKKSDKANDAAKAAKKADKADKATDSVKNVENGVESFSTNAAFDGKLYPDKKVNQLVQYLDKRGVSVMETKGNPSFTGNWDGTGVMKLPANATELQVKHELSHFIDFKNQIKQAPTPRAGVQKYVDKGRLGREQTVLDGLQNNRVWDQLNDAERSFSVDYVKRLKIEAGQ